MRKTTRHRLDDRSRYVLGWSNAAKIAALEANARKLETRLAKLGSVIAQIQTLQSKLKERLTVLSKLDEYADFRELDWQPLAIEAARLTDEKVKLESASGHAEAADRTLESACCRAGRYERDA